MTKQEFDEVSNKLNRSCSFDGRLELITAIRILRNYVEGEPIVERPTKRRNKRGRPEDTRSRDDD